MAERGEGAGGSSELENQSFFKGALKVDSTMADRAMPSSGLEAEGDGRTRLQERTPEHHGVSMLVRQAAGGLFYSHDICFQ